MAIQSNECTLGWPGGEVKVTRKKYKIVFLPLMALGNESPKEFLFGVLEDLSQDLGFWSIICVIFHVVLQKFCSTINKNPLFTYWDTYLFTVEHCGHKLDGWQCFWRYLL